MERLMRRLNGSLSRSVRRSIQDIFQQSPLDLRFALQKTLDPRVTFTRASSATFVGSSGVLQTAATNEPRFDHNPTTGESLGLMGEEARTNSIRNNTMVGAVAGTPGTLPTNWTFVGVAGLSSSIVGTGTENGIAYIDVQVNGTPTASTFANINFDTSIAASSGQAWASSVYVKLAAGSLTNTSIVQEIREVTALGAFLANSTLTVTPTSAALNTQRALLTRTLNNALTTNVRLIVSFQTTNGAAIDITLRIGLPQLEQGAFATSVIPTTSATVTRAADVASITGTNFSSWYNQTEGTVFAEASAPAVNGNMCAISNNTNNERIILDTGTNTKRLIVTNGGTQQALITRSYTFGTMTKTSTAFALNSFQIADSGLLGTEDTVGTMPSVDRLYIGANATGALPVNGTIKRLTYWPVRLGNNVLQQITQ